MSWPINVKRFYMPGLRVSFRCPKCNAIRKVNFAIEYLSYPTANEMFDYSLCCTKCAHEWSVPVCLNVSLEFG